MHIKHKDRWKPGSVCVSEELRKRTQDAKISSIAPNPHATSSPFLLVA